MNRRSAGDDATAARRHFRDAFRVITDDVAAVWLYEVTPVHAVHARFKTPAWRPEAWWRTLPAWQLDRRRSLPRDARPATD